MYLTYNLTYITYNNFMKKKHVNLFNLKLLNFIKNKFKCKCYSLNNINNNLDSDNINLTKTYNKYYNDIIFLIFLNIKIKAKENHRDFIDRCIYHYFYSKIYKYIIIWIGFFFFNTLFDIAFEDTDDEDDLYEDTDDEDDLYEDTDDEDDLYEDTDDLSSEKKNCTVIIKDLKKYRHLWVQCEHCYRSNLKKKFKSKMNICEHCGSHLKMNSLDRIELLLDTGTWHAMDENLNSLDPIEFHSEEDPYKDRLKEYQKITGFLEAIQTGTGLLHGLKVAIGFMDFQFMGGSMGSVVGEKITRLIEYAGKKELPLILVCASGGARMQEGSLSLMQMAKISSALYNYQLNKKLLYISILTSPTTGGVTASFGMLGDIIIAEPDAYIAFAGKRVIEQTLNIIVPDGVQTSEYLFTKGLFDLIVPRYFLKYTLTELLKFHI
uniref:Acetyl-coenzyme A carboxylase carboxyl transferase subunit beta n=1 Tax=Mitrastemon kanehirai TaxID=1358725 RepID=A0A4Y1MDI5_9ERIC|nr:acetyl-CoA carboxylase carboxyltransferase beta subunit [Mitrastemon kanehirai]